MRLVFTKGAGKSDTMTVVRDGRADTVIDCPKQRIIPHDMVHYAVESVLHARGFLGRIAGGEDADFRMVAEAESDGVERLVEVFQGDGWSGGTSDAAAMIDLYRVTCDARGCPMLAVDAATIDAVRTRIAELTARWDAVPAGGTLELEFDSDA
ncbi:hypothetical protein M9980_10290 [Sphingomonas donggukensis]|uniref:Uncharacterized protein n=1 Tax=Sphingomonas donggukensis TaxID=2949093 RepID=A0ABY4TSN6_9SPHN|nr:hypothetical protein [Sphingomonas donggukensis]URW74949.1 hypothetical protein M9980_10290 [Sphingomonas donggukensis]